MAVNANAVRKTRHWVGILSWFDNERAVTDVTGLKGARRIDWPRLLPFVAMHLGCLGVIWVGVSLTAVMVAVALYALRMFAITGFYHRYFSHCAFHTSRAAQFVFAVLGAAGVQRGPLWWAGQHRHHHTHSDQAGDAHSALQHGFFWSHVGWITAKHNFPTRRERVKDLLKYPELCFLDRFDIVVPIAMFVGLYGLGAWLGAAYPELGTSGLQLVVWGMISTVVLFHATFTINSLAHVWGTRRFQTTDTSRNNWLLALITLGEGWHNNHHHFQGSVRQGFYWWEYDPSYYALRAMSWLGLVWQLNPVPAAVLEKRLEKRA